MKKFALIGSGIGNSLSPALFEAAYGGKYPYGLIDSADFKTAYDRFLADCTAVNVTAPFKEAAFKAADIRSEVAELCGAANMLMKLPDGRIMADNSDFEGVTLSLMSAYSVAGCDDVDDEDAFADFLSDKTALVAGCSGAGRAAAAAVLTLGFGKTVLMNRTRSKAEALRDHLFDFYGNDGNCGLEIRDLTDFASAFSEADLVVYALPVSLWEDADILRRKKDKNKFILEANYINPCMECLSDDFTYISGLNWLLNQAVVSYESFTSEKPDEDKMKKKITILSAELNKHTILCH